LQWLQNPSQTSGDNLNNVRHETRTLRQKRRKYLKEKLSLKQIDKFLSETCIEA